MHNEKSSSSKVVTAIDIDDCGKLIVTEETTYVVEKTAKTEKIDVNNIQTPFYGVHHLDVTCRNEKDITPVLFVGYGYNNGQPILIDEQNRIYFAVNFFKLVF